MRESFLKVSQKEVFQVRDGKAKDFGISKTVNKNKTWVQFFLKSEIQEIFREPLPCQEALPLQNIPGSSQQACPS